MIQVVKQTYEEKLAMYMKCSKKELAEMLIQCNNILDNQFGTTVYTDLASYAEGELDSAHYPNI